MNQTNQLQGALLDSQEALQMTMFLKMMAIHNMLKHTSAC